MNYPREIKLNNDKLKSLITEKGRLVDKGRAKSREIEELEKEMVEVENELMEEEKKVNLKEFKKREKEITKRMDKCIKDIDKIKKEIYAKVKKETPQGLRDRYDKAKKSKEKKETERNKIALKAQKYNDKIVPLSRELMKPFLQDEYEDNETIRIEGDEIIATIFNHLEEWKINFNKRKK